MIYRIRIPDLEWDDHEKVPTSLGRWDQRYSVAQSKKTGKWHIIGGADEHAPRETMEQAKAACNAHNRQRILSMVEVLAEEEETGRTSKPFCEGCSARKGEPHKLNCRIVYGYME